MHLAIDAVGAVYGGAAAVLSDTLAAALARPEIARISVFTTPHASRALELPSHPKLSEVETPHATGAVQRAVWHSQRLAAACERLGVDALLCLSNSGYASVPYAVLIHQSLPFIQEGLNSLPFVLQMRLAAIKYFMRRSCADAAYVFVQTPVMADAVQKAFDVPAQRILHFMPTVSLPVSHQDSGCAASRQMDATPPDRRLLYVGNSSPYKRFDTLVKGMRLLRQRLPDARLFLTLPADHPFGKEPGVVCLGSIPRADLRCIYQAACVLVMPSVAETVGLPMLEAMTVGTPVLAADRPYAHAVCQDAALHFEPGDPASFAERAFQLLTDADLRARLSARGLALTTERAATRPYDRLIDVVLKMPEERQRLQALPKTSG
jgi:glycosyltransferase involved in cell wall biosynthesis